jgi:hypothetical protein
MNLQFLYIDPTDQTAPEVTVTLGTNFTVVRVEVAPVDDHFARIDRIDGATYRADDVGRLFLPFPDDRSILSLLDGTPFDEIPIAAGARHVGGSAETRLLVQFEEAQLWASHRDFASSIGADAEELFGQKNPQQK